jgi:dUTP pyrophosphatase
MARRPHPLSATLHVKKLVEEAELPRQMTEGSAGFDLCACITGPNKKLGISPGERTLVGTGIALAIDEGYEGQVRPRSGLALKNGITIVNSPGTIDSDYRGEVKVILMNTGNTTFIIEHGDRIAQLVIQAVPRIELKELAEDAELPTTDRGAGGFGSTGA